MTCRELADFIMSYLAGELSPGVRAEFERHLTLCENCTRYLATYRAAVELSRHALADPAADEDGEVPEELVKAILEARRR